MVSNAQHTPSSGNLVVTVATLHSLLPLHGPRLAAGKLKPLLDRRQVEAATAKWHAHVAAARLVLDERGVTGPVADAVIAALTVETRREISEARAKLEAKPRASVLAFRPRAAGGGQ